MVTELTCSEPGCPPFETVIAILRGGASTQHTLHQRLADVTEDDVVAVLGGH